MGYLIDGHWVVGDASSESLSEGAFVRRPSKLRYRLSTAPNATYPVAARRYHLYVSSACPWAHRTLIFRMLKGLEDTVSVSHVASYMGPDGWSFETATDIEEEPVWGATHLRDIYVQVDPNYTGRVTVPLLVDRVTRTAVNNESSDIVRFFNTELAPLGRRTPWSDYDFYPPELRHEIDVLNDRIYQTVNNGVYRAGFAKTQAAYDEAVAALFDTLNSIEERLASQRYVTGSRLTETDWRLWVTLIRFDTVYHGHFKCNRSRIVDFPNLWAFVRELFQLEGIAETVDFQQIAEHYYGSHSSVNPSGIVPVGPKLALWEPHGRDHLRAELPNEVSG